MRAKGDKGMNSEGRKGDQGNTTSQDLKNTVTNVPQDVIKRPGG